MKQLHMPRYKAMVEPDTQKRKSCFTELTDERRRCTSFATVQKLNCTAPKAYHRHDACYDDSASDTVSVTSSLFVGNEQSGFSSASNNNYGLSYAFSFEQEWDFLDVPPRLDRQQFVPITMMESRNDAATMQRETQNDEPPILAHPRPRKQPIQLDPAKPSLHRASEPFDSYAGWYNSYTPPGMMYGTRQTIWEES